MNEKIDNLLELASIQEIIIPEKIDLRIENALLNKKRKNKSFINIIKNIIIGIISVVMISFGGLVTYAKINGITDTLPNFNWINIKFNNNLKNYTNEIDVPKTIYDKTSVTLLSTVCSEYVTLLEFDVKLSDEDVEFLRLGKSVVMEEDYEEAKMEWERNIISRYIYSLDNSEEVLEKVNKDEKNRIIVDSVPQDIKDNAFDYCKEYEKETLDEIDKIVKNDNTITKDNLIRNWGFKTEEQKLEEAYDALRKREDYINVATIGFNIKEAVNNFWSYKSKDGKMYSLNWTSIILNGEEQYVRHIDTSEKIADNEYRVSILLLVPEEIINGEEFTIDINDIVVCNKGILKNNAQKKEDILSLNMDNNERVVLVDNNYKVTLNKHDVLEDSKIIENIDLKSQYKNVTQGIEKVTVTPFQTIIKSKTTVVGIDSSTSYYDEDSINWPMWVEYNVTDENGNRLECQGFETKRILIKADGLNEEWSIGDIETMSKFKNATIEYTEYYMVENNGCKKIKIEPNYRVPKKVIEDYFNGPFESEIIMPTIEVDLSM